MLAEWSASSLIMSGIPECATSDRPATSFAATVSPEVVVTLSPATDFTFVSFHSPPTSTYTSAP